MSRCPRIALAAALAIALAGLACGRYGPPRRTHERKAAAAQPAPAAETPSQPTAEPVPESDTEP
jgi:hypothetical protein